MSGTKVILFERGDAWRRALRACDPGLTGVRESRSLTETRQELSSIRRCVLGLAFTSRDAAGIVDLLAELPVVAPESVAVVLLGGSDDEISALATMPADEWDLRLAGATHVIWGRRRMREFAPLVQGHATRMARRAKPHES